MRRRSARHRAWTSTEARASNSICKAIWYPQEVSNKSCLPGRKAKCELRVIGESPKHAISHSELDGAQASHCSETPSASKRSVSRYNQWSIVSFPKIQNRNMPTLMMRLAFLYAPTESVSLQETERIDTVAVTQPRTSPQRRTP